MAEQVFPMTAEGKVKLEEELEDLITNKRQEAINRIKIARGFGDLSENSEYEAAKDEQSLIENRIVTVRNMLRNAQVVDTNNVDSNEVSVGRTVTFVESGESEEESYSIVGSAESDPFSGKISNDSPIAKALLGKKVGDTVIISTPGGDMEVKITKVQ